MTDRDDRIEISIDRVWGDAWEVYKLLFRRSVTTAAIVFAGLEAIDPLSDALDRHWASITFGILSFILGLAGTVLVQGALVEIVRDVHQGRRPKSIGALLGSAGRHLHSLVWASIVYSVGVFVGLLLVIVPGLLAAARWCLMGPLIMLEGDTAGSARGRSRDIVKPYTWAVLGTIVVTFIATSVIAHGAGSYVSFGDPPAVLGWLIRVAASALTAPFTAHVLTVIYYRLTDPEDPVIHPDVRTWQSVWKAT